MRHTMAHTQNEWRIHRCYQQGEEKTETTIMTKKMV